MNQAGLGLNADTHAKKRGELARLLGDSDNGGAIGDTDNTTRLAVKADYVAGMETEWRKDFHFEL
jgi:hypothetical protein